MAIVRIADMYGFPAWQSGPFTADFASDSFLRLRNASGDIVYIMHGVFDGTDGQVTEFTTIDPATGLSLVIIGGLDVPLNVVMDFVTGADPDALFGGDDDFTFFAGSMSQVLRAGAGDDLITGTLDLSVTINTGAGNDQSSATCRC